MATTVGVVAEGLTTEEIVAEFPQLTVEDVHEALRYAGAAVDEHELPPSFFDVRLLVDESIFSASSSSAPSPVCIFSKSAARRQAASRRGPSLGLERRARRASSQRRTKVPLPRAGHRHRFCCVVAAVCYPPAAGDR